MVELGSKKLSEMTPEEVFGSKEMIDVRTLKEEEKEWMKKVILKYLIELVKKSEKGEEGRSMQEF